MLDFLSEYISLDFLPDVVANALSDSIPDFLVDFISAAASLDPRLHSGKKEILLGIFLGWRWHKYLHNGTQNNQHLPNRFRHFREYHFLLDPLLCADNVPGWVHCKSQRKIPGNTPDQQIIFSARCLSYSVPFFIPMFDFLPIFLYNRIIPFQEASHARNFRS